MKTAEKKQVKKVKKITIRLNKEEHEILKKLVEKEGLTINDFIRSKILSFKPKRKVKENCDEKKRLLYEIHKIGVNLNQIAKLSNWFLKVDMPVEEVLKYLEKIADSLEEIDKDLKLLLLELLKEK
jgi:hypothetical protein